MSWELPVATSCDVHSPATAPPKASMPQVHLELQILHHKAPKSSKAPLGVRKQGQKERTWHSEITGKLHIAALPR